MSDRHTDRSEPGSAAALDLADSFLASPTAGEVADDLGERDPSRGAQQASPAWWREVPAHRPSHGWATAEANRQILRNGRAD